MTDPTDAELHEVAMRVRRHARAELVARTLGAFTGLAVAGVLVFALARFFGWVIPAFAGLASGGLVYRYLMPADLPED